MRHAVGMGFLVSVLIVVTGCATKDWVREMVGTKEKELGQRIETRVGAEAQRIDKVEGRVSEESQRIEGMGFRMKGIETSVSQVDEVAKGAQARADGAQARADAAFTKADEVDGRLTRVWSKRNTRNMVETFQVQFAFDKSNLSDGAQTLLLSVLKELKANPNLTVDLAGYADPTGARDYNVGLSQRRVEAVRRYLVEQGVELPRINSVGLGPIMEKVNGEERAKLRRVTVKLMVAPE